MVGLSIMMIDDQIIMIDVGDQVSDYRTSGQFSHWLRFYDELLPWNDDLIDDIIVYTNISRFFSDHLSDQGPSIRS